MATISKVEYYVVYTANKPGAGAQLLKGLQQHGVNLLAMTAFPKGINAQVDLMPEKPAALKAVAKKLGVTLGPKKIGFMVQGTDRTGAMTGILATLGKAGINVVAIDAVSAGWKRFGAIFWVKPAQIAKAAKLLKAK